jgi:hypothetical protein
MWKIVGCVVASCPATTRPTTSCCILLDFLCELDNCSVCFLQMINMFVRRLHLHFLHTYLPYGAVLLEKLTSFQLVKKLPAFYGTQRFSTAFTGARHLSTLYIHSGLLIMQQQVNIITNQCFAGCNGHVTCVNSWPDNRTHRKSQGDLCLPSKYISFLDRFEVLTAALVTSVVYR